MKVRTRKRLSANAFCPTGEGGGVDPSCSSSTPSYDRPSDRLVKLSIKEAQEGSLPGIGRLKTKLVSVAVSKLVGTENPIRESPPHKWVAKQIKNNIKELPPPVVSRGGLDEVTREPKRGVWSVDDGHHRVNELIKSGHSHIWAIAVYSKDEPSTSNKHFPFTGLSSTENAFCATGPGSGQDNSCSGKLTKVSDWREMSIRAKRKILRNVRKSGVGPNRIDPTQTTTMRRAFLRQIKGQFALLRGKVRKLVVDEDAFGLGVTENAFCPGEGARDNSCSSAQSRVDKGQSAFPHASAPYDKGNLGISRQQKLDLPVQQVPIDKIKTVQRTADPAKVQYFLKGGTAPQPGEPMAPGSKFVTIGPWAVKTPDGNYYLEDGNTRGSAAAIRGDKTFRLKVVEIGSDGKWVGPTTNRYQFRTSPEKIVAFQDWLRGQLGSGVTSKTSESLWHRYAEAGYRKGQGRAFDDVNRSRRFSPGQGEFYAGSRDEFLRSSFGRPVNVEKIKLLAGRSFDDLENVTADMSTRMSRTLTDGLTQGMNPREVARLMDEDMDLAEGRAMLIATTELTRVHAEGQLSAMKDMGVAKVGAMVEFSTAGDERVCPECEELEGKEFTLEDAAGIIPLHPACRCSWLPAGFGDFDDATENAFCPTGPGGGQDNSCSPYAAAVQEVREQLKDDPGKIARHLYRTKRISLSGLEVQEILKSDKTTTQVNVDTKSKNTLTEFTRGEAPNQVVSSSRDAPVQEFAKVLRESIEGGARVSTRFRDKVFQVSLDVPTGGFASTTIFRSRDLQTGKYQFTFQHGDTSLPKESRGSGLGGRLVAAQVAGYRALGVRDVHIHMDTNPAFWNHMRSKFPDIFSEG